MSAVAIPNMGWVHISFGGSDRFITDAGGRTWKFEAHPRFGPVVLNGRGDPAPNQPGSRSPFWHPWSCWTDQGCRLQPDGQTCVWDQPPPPPELVRLAGRGRNFAVAGSALAEKYGVKRSPK